MIFVPAIEAWAAIFRTIPTLLPAFNAAPINSSAVEVFGFLIKWNWVAPVSETMFIFGFMVILLPVLLGTKFFIKGVDWFPFKFS
jgi:hypothetical protein